MAVKRAEAMTIELPTQLIEQYKRSLSKVTDIRLVVMLAFNAFEEIMKSFVAWRLSCGIESLPRLNPSLLFELAVAGESTASFRSRIKLFADLRHEIAHRFHRREYEERLKAFIEGELEEPCLTSERERRKALLQAVSALAMSIAVVLNDFDARAEFPVPMLSLELGS